MKPSSTIRILCQCIDEGYFKKAWHGPNLRGSIRGLTAKKAMWRSAKNRHNIWEIVMHCAYWKYIVRRRILGEKRGTFPLKGSNWFRCPDKLTEAAWKQDVKLLDDMHRRMVDAIVQFKQSDLKKFPRGSTYSNRAIIFGIVAHDVYHAGQIQLLKKFSN